MSNSVAPDGPMPRLCHLKKWPDFAGYGFNLHAEKGKVGQYIGKVDEGSPAHLAGLKENDRIVEVNGVNVGNENHQQVVERIKANPNETKLFVVDKETDNYYKERKLVIRSDQPNVQIIECPDSKTGSAKTTVTPSPAVNGDAEVELKPRLCVLRIRPDFQGYGFNLHAEKGKPGQFIGKVDEGSPAEASGLREGDFIVEINYENISTNTHGEVVSRIKASPSLVRMLVIDPAGWQYAQSHGILVEHSMPSVQVIDPHGSTVETEAVVEADGETKEDDIPSDAPHPRLCHIIRWPDFEGYGFNLHAEKGMSGHFIGTVDEGSPAVHSGLRQGDRIVEVNEENVWSLSHQVVVQKIKTYPNKVSMLVADPQTLEFYKNRNYKINSSMQNVDVFHCPDNNPANSPPEDEPLTMSTREDEEEAAPVVAAAVAAAPVAAAFVAADDDAPRPRLCHLKQWSDFTGYGFNLQVEKNRKGHFVGGVEDQSPAFYAGLKKGDRIVEVNGDNVWDETHQDTVVKIKSRGTNVELLVFDPETEEYYRNKKIIVSSSQDNIERIVCPDENPHSKRAEVLSEVATVSAGADGSIPSDAPQARLCVLKKWADFQGYGFNLMVVKGRTGNFIGSVEEGSPAYHAGLKDNDKIIEVNGENIQSLKHAEVVARIKTDPAGVSILAVDTKTEDYYQNNNIEISSSMPNVQRIECPDERPRTSSISGDTGSTVVVGDSGSTVVVASKERDKKRDSQISDGPNLRLCVLRRWDNYQGYGFNLQVPKGKVGNYIGAVDLGSPAHYAGLKDGDRVVEVNGTYAFTEQHAQVVELIKQDPKKVKLLVVDRPAEDYYTSKDIQMDSSLSNIQTIECPAEKPIEAINGTLEKTDNKRSSSAIVQQQKAPTPAVNNNAAGIDGLTNLSAAELRERLKSKKKQDPRKANMSLQEKKAIYDSL